ncbi:MAG: ion channel, partial [Acetobacter persici]|uniref:ion channel n=1 Tax=Acetobacter persici TaxID=1076596 RepID=UPI0039EBAF3A
MKSLFRHLKEKREAKLTARYNRLDDTPLEDTGKTGKKSHFTTKEAIRRFRTHALVEEKAHRDVVRVGLSDSVWTDLYHHALTASWPSFVYWSVISYFLINLFFALLYLVAPGQVTGDSQHTLLSLFFFSVQTLSTVGYGGMVPVGPYANVILTFEVLIGMMINALATGV